MATVLSIAPYKYLKPRNGGHWGILAVDRVLSVHNDVFTLSVQSNEAFETPFTQLNLLADKRTRYLPFSITRLIVAQARKKNVQNILCHHPYLYFSVKRAARILGIPFFIRSHNIESERFRSMGKIWWPLVAFLEKMAYRNAKAVFYVTEEDAQWGQEHYDLPAASSIVLPYPISSAAFEQTKASRDEVAQTHGIDPAVPWYCFMGDLSYAPNADAVKNILEEIYPRLKKAGAAFQILICGKGLGPDMQKNIEAAGDIYYLGFVDDIKSVLNHSQLMLNAVTYGGGVKVKVLEALSENLTVISTRNGATGINASVCGDKLRTVADRDWDDFVAEMLKQEKTLSANIPDSFFEHYYYKNVADRMQQYL